MSVVVKVDFRPANSRAEELLGYLRAAGPRKGLTSREMNRYMPRASWQSALRQLEDPEKWPGLILKVERRPKRRRKPAWTRAVLKGEFAPTVEEPSAPEPEPAQTSLFDEDRAA